MQPFFSSNRQRRDAGSAACNCSTNVRSEAALVVDLSEDGYTEVVFVDADTMSLMAADMDACYCRVLMTTSKDDRKGIMFNVRYNYTKLFSS